MVIKSIIQYEVLLFLFDLFFMQDKKPAYIYHFCRAHILKPRIAGFYPIPGFELRHAPVVMSNDANSDVLIPRLLLCGFIFLLKQFYYYFCI